MLSYLLATTLIAIASTADFNISSTSICTNVSVQGFCLRWQQSGTVVQNYGACFPATAKVMTPSGLTTMDKLHKGDQILALENGEEVFTEITSWFHHDPTAQMDYLRVAVANSHFEVSPKHNIALDDLSYAFAEELTGKILFGSTQPESLKITQNIGLYAPKTNTNNYFVFLEDGQTKVLAHCFAHIRNPQNYELAVSAIQSLWDLLITTNPQEQVHPSYPWMQNTFAFLQE